MSKRRAWNLRFSIMNTYFLFCWGCYENIFVKFNFFARKYLDALSQFCNIFFFLFFSPNTVTVFSPQLEWMSAYDICTVYCRPRWFTCMVNMLVLFYHVRDLYKWLFILCMLDNYLKKKKHIKYIVYCGGSLIYSAQDCRAALITFVMCTYCGQCPA